MQVVHYFEEFDHIEVKGGKVRQGVEIRVLCGATEGKAVNHKRDVTCPDCKRLLEERC
jgi:hypothetical protein